MQAVLGALLGPGTFRVHLLPPTPALESSLVFNLSIVPVLSWFTPKCNFNGPYLVCCLGTPDTCTTLRRDSFKLKAIR